MAPKEPIYAPEIHTEDVALFSKPPVNVAEEKISWVETRPSFMSSGDYSSIQFNIAGNSTQYVDLGRTELYVKLKIEKEDGTPFSTEEGKKEYGLPVDQILQSMWSSVDIKLNHTLVTFSGTDYMYKALFETLLNYNENAKRIQMSTMGFSGESGDFTQTNPEAPPFNHGLRARFSWFKGVKYVEFIGPLMADICNQDRLILNGVDIDIKLWPTRDEFRIMSHPSGIPCKLSIDEIVLNVCKVTVSPEVMVGHDAGLQESESKYPFQRTDIRTFNIPQNSYGTVLEDIWQGEVPSRLVIGMVRSQAYNGDFSLNPFMFENFDISTAGFYVNNEPTPRPPFKLDFENGEYMEGLLSLYRVSGKLMENTDIGITRETYRQGYSLIGFNVDPTSSPDFRYIGIPKQGHTKLELKFKRHLPAPVTLILYATFPETMEIDKYRTVTLEVKDKLKVERDKRSRG